MGSSVETMLTGIGQAWAWIVAFGVLSIILGLAAIPWPGATLVAIALLFATS